MKAKVSLERETETEREKDRPSSNTKPRLFSKPMSNFPGFGTIEEWENKEYCTEA